MPTLLSINNYHYYRGGAETVFLEHNRLFSAAGWHVVPFAMTHPRNLPSGFAGHFVDEIEFGGDYGLLGKLRRVPKVIYSFEARRKLAVLLDRTRPDIAHGHNIYHHLSPSILGLLHDRGVPTVLTLHDLKIACPAYSMLAPDGVCERCKGGRLHNVLVQRCIKGSLALSGIVYLEALLHTWLGSYTRSVDLFAVPSRFYMAKLASWGVPPGKLVHVPNFVDCAAVSPEYAPGKDFLFFGRLSREKGVATLLRAAARAGVGVRVAGTGPQEAELREIAATARVRVVFLGHLRGAQLRQEIGAARAVVLPSEWYENAPMSVLEAYAQGKPVIGADIAGIPELIRDGETGAVFASGDESSLAGALERFAAAGSAELSAYGRCGRNWVESEFTAMRYRERMSAIYAGLTAAAGAA